MIRLILSIALTLYVFLLATKAATFVDIVLDIFVAWLFLSIFYIIYLKLTMGC